MLLKRLIDILVSSIVLILLAPVILVLAVLIKLESPGPAIFRQERVGKDGVTFQLLKLRSMRVDQEKEMKMDFTGDAVRMTIIGKFIRRTKFDETLQLINVFKGEMSLVGPRPTVWLQVKEYSQYEWQRLQVKPGMTGLAQVNGNTALSWEERIKYDVYYVNNWSIFLDLSVLLKTIVVVIFGEGKFIKSPGKD